MSKSFRSNVIYRIFYFFYLELKVKYPEFTCFVTKMAFCFCFEVKEVESHPRAEGRVLGHTRFFTQTQGFALWLGRPWSSEWALNVFIFHAGLFLKEKADDSFSLLFMKQHYVEMALCMFSEERKQKEWQASDEKSRTSSQVCRRNSNSLWVSVSQNFLFPMHSLDKSVVELERKNENNKIVWHSVWFFSIIDKRIINTSWKLM